METGLSVRNYGHKELLKEVLYTDIDTVTSTNKWTLASILKTLFNSRAPWTFEDTTSAGQAKTKTQLQYALYLLTRELNSSPLWDIRDSSYYILRWSPKYVGRLISLANFYRYRLHNSFVRKRWDYFHSSRRLQVDLYADAIRWEFTTIRETILPYATKNDRFSLRALMESIGTNLKYNIHLFKLYKHLLGKVFSCFE